ncbi:50S ribosomal protein L21 [Candidatus Gracilibacteria bacterium]|nr:50S ribosomal protein L21 [Candidatus Gracilibacteria bacterium]
MIAVLELGGNQFTVKVGDVIDVDNQDQEVGSTIKVNPLLVSDENGKSTKIGSPILTDMNVELKVLENFRDDKVKVFKMKSKKRYARTKGFRAALSKLEVLTIA